MQYVALPRVQSVLKEREDKIEGDRAHARALQTQTQEYREHLHVSLEEARCRARDEVAASTNSMLVAATARKNEILDLMMESFQSSEDRLQRQKKQAMKDIKIISEEMSVALVEKMLSLKVDHKDLSKTLDQVINEKVA